MTRVQGFFLVLTALEAARSADIIDSTWALAATLLLCLDLWIADRRKDRRG